MFILVVALSCLTLGATDMEHKAKVVLHGQPALAASTTLRDGFMSPPRENYPSMWVFKPCADRAFCDGLTRVCYHGMLMSIPLDAFPGDTRRAGESGGFSDKTRNGGHKDV